jgi:GDP-L-fucose synthase
LLLAAEEIDSSDGGKIAVNIAAGKGYTVREVLQTIIEVDGYIGAEVTFDTTKPSTIPIRLVDTSRAKKLGFTAKTSLYDGLVKTVEWYRENINAYH